MLVQEMGKLELLPASQTHIRSSSGPTICQWVPWIRLIICLLALRGLLDIISGWGKVENYQTKYSSFEQCSVASFVPKARLIMRGLTPITKEEFITRQGRLAEALMEDKIDAFVVEPGYTFKYYANVSQFEWEPWEPEERPFLMIIQPVLNESGHVTAKTSFLAPNFEAERVKLLGIPVQGELQIVTWAEHWDPYRTLANANLFTKSSPKVMVDEEMRDYISRGLASVNFHTIGYGGNVEKVRQIKSGHEAEILKAVNTATVEAIRQMRNCLVPGLTETEVQRGLDSALRAGGLEPFFDIVLFDEAASNPHGGTDGQKRLDRDTFVLIDVGAHLYGYSSDVCRTFFPPFLPDNEVTRLRLKKKIGIWDIVFQAQTASIGAFRKGNAAAAVDIAARQVISEAGYGKAFTHRVGHGIGIKAHESPYLHKGNNGTTLVAGMAFTTEPGVYLVNEFGVRHEDIFLITEGLPECLSCPRAVDPWTP